MKESHLLSAERVIQADHPIINHFLTAEERSSIRATCRNAASGKTGGVFGNIIQIQFLFNILEDDCILTLMSFPLLWLVWASKRLSGTCCVFIGQTR